MQLFQVDTDGALFIATAIADWGPLAERGIDTVIDLEGDLDHCIPTISQSRSLHLLSALRRGAAQPREAPLLADLAARLIRSGHKVLSHCGMDSTGPPWFAGLTLCRLG
jgi:hypothetical protein